MTEIRLKSLKFTERKGRPLEWTLDGLTLGPINLLVGKNAAGKSRTLNVISGLAKQLLQDQIISGEGKFEVVFENNENILFYLLDISGAEVVEERLEVDDEVKLQRKGGKLTIFAEEVGRHLKFEPLGKEVAAVARRDNLQHPFLLPLRDWAESVRSYHFGSPLGKDHLAILIKNDTASDDGIDDRDENKVVTIFQRGKKDHGSTYVEAVISDMRTIGYELSSIDTGNPGNVLMSVTPRSGSQSFPLDAGQVHAIGVVEQDIPATIYQASISQGMFRALSILVQVNYSQMAGRANCVVIDDIGEGLDFDRSSLLIDVLRDKAEQSDFQLIMATNDQFVMNHVPLDEWSVLQRDGSHVTVKNIRNSPKEFEEFKFVGMSNFAFFEMDFLSGPPAGEEAGQHE